MCTSDSPQVAIAAKEVRRYFYLRTGELPAVSRESGAGNRIILAVKGNSAIGNLGRPELLSEISSLQPQQYLIRTFQRGGDRTLLVVGGDGVGTLYGAYRLAERLGVGFYLHGDVVPDGRIPVDLPEVNETGRPIFDVRGINPFHDFPEGPDWWTTDDYLAHVTQLAKMRMNFIGLHCYPAGSGPEPTVWIGLPGEYDTRGRVRTGYPVVWDTTLRAGWGYAPLNTGDFAAGASLLFAKDGFGAEALEGTMPWARTDEAAVRVFNNAGEMFRTAFAHARRLGVRTCVGTETPLWMPDALKERLRRQGKDPASPAVVQEVYEGMFGRIAAAHGADYYWLWTPEGWTWSGNLPEHWAATARDIQAAQWALDKLGKPLTLATCGWVLGPQEDRAAIDKVLAPGSPMSCISRDVGHAALDRGFAAISNRPKWAIPWLENDPNMIAPQPWVGRMLYDACDARRLACTGLIGIHWRTKVLGPNLSALAGAAWDQSWARPLPPNPPVAVSRGSLGGTAQFTAPVAGTADTAVYQSVRFGLSAYDVKAPNGTYAVTLLFNEPYYGEAGKRVFGVSIQDKRVIDRLDMFARVGKNRAFDMRFADVRVTDGRIKIDFIPIVEFPCIAGIVVEGRTEAANQLPAQAYLRKINIGGGKYMDYEADALPQTNTAGDRERSMPVEGFYRHFARMHFGDEVSEAAGRIMSQLDGLNFPQISSWVNGPGNITISRQPWEQVKGLFRFADEFEALRPRVRGAGNLARFDYWMHTFRYTAAAARCGCCRGALDAAVEAMKAQKDAAKKAQLAAKAVALRVELARLWEAMLTHQIAATDTPGEMGTIANLERHNRINSEFLIAHDKEIVAVTVKPLPEEAALSATYSGPARIIVPTVRTQVRAGESLTVKIIVLDRQPPTRVELLCRSMGRGEFQQVQVRHLGRGVYQATLPAAKEDFEYHVRAKTAGGSELVWPAASPQVSQTVIVLPD